MKNITLSADDHLIEAARARARAALIVTGLAMLKMLIAAIGLNPINSKQTG